MKKAVPYFFSALFFFFFDLLSRRIAKGRVACFIAFLFFVLFYFVL